MFSTVICILVMGAYVWFVHALVKGITPQNHTEQKNSAARQTSPARGRSNKGSVSSFDGMGLASWSESSGNDELTTEDYIMLDDIQDMLNGDGMWD